MFMDITSIDLCHKNVGKAFKNYHSLLLSYYMEHEYSNMINLNHISVNSLRKCYLTEFLNFSIGGQFRSGNIEFCTTTLKNTVHNLHNMNI